MVFKVHLGFYHQPEIVKIGKNLVLLKNMFLLKNNVTEQEINFLRF